MLLVNDLAFASESVVDFLKDKIFVIVYKKPISRKIEERLPFVLVNSKNLRIDEDKYFGFIDKNYFEIEKNKIDWASKIINDYKNEKSQLISR